MAVILNKEEDESLQTYFSNSKTLAERQMQLFEDLWNMAIPFSTRMNELEYENKRDNRKIMTDFENIRREIESLLLTCKEELTIFSSNRILGYFLNESDFSTIYQRYSEKKHLLKFSLRM
jgi:hypothetical protein